MYFPEYFLSLYFHEKLGENVPVYTIQNGAGAADVCEAYKAIAAELNLACIILVDGGTDSLMRGDEEKYTTAPSTRV